jgi:hypothetical protein
MVVSGVLFRAVPSSSIMSDSSKWLSGIKVSVTLHLEVTAAPMESGAEV